MWSPNNRLGDRDVETRYQVPPPKSYNPKVVISSVTTLVVILLAVSVVGAYYGDSSGQAKDFFNRNITVGQSLLMIALPITVMGVLTAFVLYIHTKKKHMAERSHEEITFYKSLKDTLTLHKSQKRKIKTALIVISFTALIAAVILLANPTCNQWLNNQAIPGIERAMSHSITLWQGLAYTGGGSLAAMIMVNFMIHFFQQRQYHVSEENIDSGNGGFVTL